MWLKVHLHTHYRTERDNVRWRTLNNTVPEDPGPITGPVKASQLISTSPEKCKDQRWTGTKWRTQKGHLVPVSPRCLPGKSQPPVQAWNSSTSEHLSDWVVFLPRWMGDIVGCRGKASQNCRRLTMGCLGDEPKAGKGMDLHDLGRNNMEKQGWRVPFVCEQWAGWYACLALLWLESSALSSH